MDPLGLLAAMVAVSLFPGGGYSLAIAAAACWPCGDGRGEAWTPGRLIGLGSILLAGALVPLPGSPAASLPWGGPDAAPTLLALLLLYAVGIGLIASPEWSRARICAAVGAVIPLLVLASLAGSLALPAMVAATGAGLGWGRALAGLAVLAAAPQLTAQALETPRLARAAGISGMAMVAIVLAAGPLLAPLGSVWEAVVAALAGAGFARLLLRMPLRPETRRATAVLTALFAAAATASMLAGAPPA